MNKADYEAHADPLCLKSHLKIQRLDKDLIYKAYNVVFIKLAISQFTKIILF